MHIIYRQVNWNLLYRQNILRMVWILIIHIMYSSHTWHYMQASSFLHIAVTNKDI